LATEKGLRSIAFPAISTGAFGYPPEQAAPVVSETIESVLDSGTLVEQVRLVFYEAEDARLFLENQRFTTHRADANQT
jgi:O-acetyl-ADP-ribose deacetylase (regulator of RNase III)